MSIRDKKLTEEDFPEQHLSQYPTELEPFEDTPQGMLEAEINKGFSGTFKQLLEWLDTHLMYGRYTFKELDETKENNPYYGDHKYYEFNLIPGGSSIDKMTISLLRNCVYLNVFWQSSHRGGLDVYHIPEFIYESEKTFPWFEPNQLDSLYINRSNSVLRIEGPTVTTEFYLPDGFQITRSNRESTPNSQYVNAVELTLKSLNTKRKSNT